MANVKIKLGYKDSAWFTANAALVLDAGQVVFLSGTPVKFKRGDGTTALSVLQFNTKEQDDHIANTSNPHNVTKSQVGLSNVDNTADASKPVSTAQAAADAAVLSASETYSDGKVEDAINNGVINKAPSENAVFDALANKQSSLGFTPEDSANKNQASGYAGLDSGGLIPAALLPSYVDDVLEYANLAAFPGTGETGKIYVAKDTNKTYRWSGSIYVEISASPGSTDSVTEGSVNLYFTAARVLATVLTGLSLATNAVISASDTVLSALGKLQKQISDNLTSLNTHIGDTSNPHSTTKSQVGLGNVDNTSDANKPVSTAQAAADSAVQSAAASDATTKANAAQAAAIAACPAETNATIGVILNAATGKTTPVDADTLPLTDSAASNVLKKVTWANIKATLKSYFDTLYTIKLSVTAVKTTDYSANANEFVPVDTTSGIVSITFPNAPVDGTLIAIKMVTQGGTNTVGLILQGSDVFNKTGGATSGTLTLLNQSIIVQYKASGAIWYVIADDQSLSQLDLRYERLINKDATGGYVGMTLFKIDFKNAANTFTSFFTNSNTASRTYTYQDRNGVVADDTDLALKVDTTSDEIELALVASFKYLTNN